MYRNLLAEMARNGLNRYDIANATGRSYNHVREKLMGRYPFTLDEANDIHEKLFPNLEFSYLFEKHEEKEETTQ